MNKHPGLLSAIFSFLTFIPALLSCSSKEWGEIYNLPGNEWKANELIVFRPDSASIRDSITGKLSIFVRYGNGIEVEKVPLGVSITRNGSPCHADTLVMQLFNKKTNGRRDKNEILGAYYCEDSLPGQSTIHAGDRIEIYLAPPLRQISDIYNVGVILSP